jgi:hypothetical protein
VSGSISIYSDKFSYRIAASCGLIGLSFIVYFSGTKLNQGLYSSPTMKMSERQRLWDKPTTNKDNISDRMGEFGSEGKD